jgi:hypothetical protein
MSGYVCLSSCPDLIRASIDLRKMHFFQMDCRVKPGNDELRTLASEASLTTHVTALSLVGLIGIAVWERFSRARRVIPSVLNIRWHIDFPDRGDDRGPTGLLQNGLRFGRQQESHKIIRIPGVFCRSRNQCRILDRIAHIDARREADDFNVVPRGDGCRIINHTSAGVAFADGAHDLGN